jgi:hypothetical protein
MRLILLVPLCVFTAGCATASFQSLGSYPIQGAPGSSIEVFQVKTRDPFGNDLVSHEKVLTNAYGEVADWRSADAASAGAGKIALPAVVLGISDIGASYYYGKSLHPPRFSNVENTTISQEGGQMSMPNLNVEGARVGDISTRSEGGAGGSSHAQGGQGGRGGDGGRGGTSSSVSHGASVSANAQANPNVISQNRNDARSSSDARSDSRSAAGARNDTTVNQRQGGQRQGQSQDQGQHQLQDQGQHQNQGQDQGQSLENFQGRGRK